jgi:hypothetical protein
VPPLLLLVKVALVVLTSLALACLLHPAALSVSLDSIPLPWALLLLLHVKLALVALILLALACLLHRTALSVSWVSIPQL